MGNRRIDVGIKPILTGLQLLPSVKGFFIRKTNADNGLNAFETVFPRHHQTPRSTILIRQLFAKHTRNHNAQRVISFIHTQAFGIGPVDT